MDKITVGVLTVSDRCDRKEATDESGPNLVSLIERGIIENGEVVKTDLVPDEKSVIEAKLKSWCEDGIDLILTTGGTGVSERDTTPEATLALSGKLMPGVQHLILKRGLELTPFAALSRAVPCVVGKTFIINLPGSKKGAQQCLEAAAEVIPHVVDLIKGRERKVERVHASVGTKRSSVVVGDVANRLRESPYPCISVAEAQNIIMDRINFLKRDKVINWKNALGHVLAEDVAANDYLPPTDVSIYDGYAVLSSDLNLDKELSIISVAGDALPDVKILPGHCARVNTGATMPPGTDAVIPLENTILKQSTESGKEEKEITLLTIPTKGYGIRKRGEDHAMGKQILGLGTYLDSPSMGVLAAAGITSVRVFEKPPVAVLSTGNELVEPHERLTPGKVRDSNRITVISLLKEEGVDAMDLGICVDEPDALRNSLEMGFQRADVVVTTGSMSMGDRDYLKEILVQDFNAEICFGRVLMKPGKPTAFAVLMFEGKPKVWFGLPGNPSSAFVATHLFLLPALRKISGFRSTYPVVLKTTLKEVVTPEDRPQYVRGVISYNEYTNEWDTILTGKQNSSRIGNCVDANCLVLIPAANMEKNKSSKPVIPAANMEKNKSSKPVAFFGDSQGKINTYPSQSVSSGIALVPATKFNALLIGKVYSPVNDRLAN